MKDGQFAELTTQPAAGQGGGVIASFCLSRAVIAAPPQLAEPVPLVCFGFRGKFHS